MTSLSKKTGVVNTQQAPGHKHALVCLDWLADASCCNFSAMIERALLDCLLGSVMSEVVGGTHDRDVVVRP